LRKVAATSPEDADKDRYLRFFLPDGRRCAALDRRGCCLGPDTGRGAPELPEGRAALTGVTSGSASSLGTSAEAVASGSSSRTGAALGALPTATFACRLTLEAR